MPNIGFSELLLLAVIALLIVGPERLPALMHAAGSGLARIRGLMNSLMAEVERSDSLEEIQRELRDFTSKEERRSLPDEDAKPD